MSRESSAERFNILLQIVRQQDLSDFKSKCKQYLDKLTDWQQYIIISYTAWSRNINYYLLGQNIDQKEYYDYMTNLITSFLEDFPNIRISSTYQRYINTSNLHNLSAAYNLLAREIQAVIQAAPKSDKAFFVVKVTNIQYADLPTRPEELGIIINQPLFNSTTLDVGYDLTSFLDEKVQCCYFIVHIPVGVPALYIAPDHHEFPDQEEVLLPYNTKLKYIDYTDTMLYEYDEGREVIPLKAWYATIV